MTSFENDPPSDEDASFGDLGFSWVEDVETEVFSPADERLIQEASVPVRRPKTLTGELTAEFQKRLENMRVEDPKSATIFRVRRLERLYWHLRPYSLEDVHYIAYEKVRNSAQIPYISVTFRELLYAMPESEAQLDVLQSKQTSDAFGNLVDLGINHNELKKMERGSEEDQYHLRTLDRLLKESYLSEFNKKIAESSGLKFERKLLGFDEVSLRAARVVLRKYEWHMNHDVSLGGSDAQMWHELERRSLERALSFARPLTDRAQRKK
jgi:hypothetical protein